MKMSGGGYNPEYYGKAAEASAPADAYVSAPVIATPVAPPRAGTSYPVAGTTAGASKETVDPEWLRQQQGECGAFVFVFVLVCVCVLACLRGRGVEER